MLSVWDSDSGVGLFIDLSFQENFGAVVIKKRSLRFRETADVYGSVRSNPHFVQRILVSDGRDQQFTPILKRNEPSVE
jgi:hypothetical protein